MRTLRPEQVRKGDLIGNGYEAVSDPLPVDEGHLIDAEPPSRSGPVTILYRPGDVVTVSNFDRPGRDA